MANGACGVKGTGRGFAEFIDAIEGTDETDDEVTEAADEAEEGTTGVWGFSVTDDDPHALKMLRDMTAGKNTLLIVTVGTGE